MLIQEPVQAAIWHCINNYAFEDATFLAERLCSEVETDEGVFILATCYYRSNQLYQAYWLLYTKKIKSPQCRLLLAQCCYDLKKYSEAEKALNNKHFTQIEHLEYIIEEFGDIACFALRLLAKICSITERHDIATAARIRTLKLNPFLWNTFIDLCNRGGIIDNAASNNNADHTDVDDDNDENTSNKINESDDDMSSGDYNSNNKLEPNKIFQFNTTDTFLTCQGNNPLSVIWINNNNNNINNNNNNTINNINISNNTNNTININNNNNNSGNNNNNNNKNEKTYNELSNRVPINETTNQNYQYVTPNNNQTTKATSIQNNYNNNCGDETPINKQNSINDIDPNWIFSATPPHGEKFKYLSAINSITPSFGVLPIINQSSGTTLNDSLIFYSPLQHYQPQQQQQQTTPQQQQQQQQHQQHQTPQQQLQKTPRNQIDVTPTDQRPPTIHLLKQHNLGKKGKDKIGIIHRSKPMTTAPTPPTPLILSKLFSHTNISPRTPNNLITTTTGSTTTTPITPATTTTTTTNTLGIGGVRRSSRLFSNNNNNNNFAVKENSNSNNTNTNRSPYILNKFATPRSPPRKTNKRITKLLNLNGNEKITANNEINEKFHQNTNYKNNLHNINNNLINHNTQSKIETVTLSENKIFNKSVENNLLHLQQQPQLHQLLLLQQQQQKEAINERIMNLKKQSADGLMSLLRKLANGYVKLSEFNCKEAIEIFQEIPHHHYLSSWVQSQIARAYFEQRNYEMAAKIYQEIHHKEPYRLLGMDIYSTALWHLQREIQLSALAQDLMKLDKKSSPIIWLVSGNCFSLHKEHETAIKFFERAVQIDSDYPYSYTLLGHELAITEELEKGMSCYRTAIVKDLRHYNAWFGMGSIFAKQERYNLAEIHYKRALSINPKNSVILVHIGAMQFFLQKITAAWQSLQVASELDPKNPLCKFHRGSMLFQTGQYAEALNELEELTSLVPKESVVYYLIGKIHKKMGNIDLALMHFSWATDLDPKGTNNQIKDAFDVNIVQNATGNLTATPITTPNATAAIVTTTTSASALSTTTATTITTTTTATTAASRSETPIITTQDETQTMPPLLIPSTVTLIAPNPITTTTTTTRTVSLISDPIISTIATPTAAAPTITNNTIIVTATTTMTTSNATNTNVTGNNIRIGSLDVAINNRRRSGNNSGGSASGVPTVSGGGGGIPRAVAALAHIDDHILIRNRISTNVLTTTSTTPNELNVIPTITATSTVRTTTTTTPATAMASQFLSNVRGYRSLAVNAAAAQNVNNANNEADEEDGETEADDEGDDEYDSFNAETYSAMDDDDGDDLDDDVDEDDDDADEDDDDDDNNDDINDNDINDHDINDNNITTDNNINDNDNVANVNISNRLDISDEIRAMLIDGINENAEELPTEEYLDNLLNLNSDDSLENILIDGNTVNDSFITEHPFRPRRDSGTGGAGGGVGR